MLLIAPEVADALAAGGPVVALESTLIAHGLPRPRNAEVARELEQAVRDHGAVPATIALLDGVVRIGLDDAALEAIATRDDVAKCSARDLPIAMARRRHRRDDRRRHRPPRRAGRDPAVRDRRARRRAPRGARDLGRVGRPRRALAHRHLRRLRGGEVDPRRAGHARAAGDARRRRRRLPDRPLPRLLPHRLRPPGAVAARHAGAGRRRAARRATSSSSTARSCSPTRCPPTSSSTPTCTRACSPTRSRPPSARAIRGRDITPFLLARFHAETGGESLRANIRLVLRNAELAAQIAVALAA